VVWQETKDILIDLINAVLSDSDFEPVASIALRSPVNSRQAVCPMPGAVCFTGLRFIPAS